MGDKIKFYAETCGFDHASAMIVNLYSEPHRKYHNTDHIESLIDVALSYGYRNPHPIFPTILLHDLIYNPCCRYNEELSAEAYWGLSGDDNRTPEHYAIYAAIRASKNHLDKDNVRLPRWAKDFLDFDLMGLASDEYRANGVKIWYEYKPFVSLYDFVDGRTKFLEGLLASSQIYWNHPEWEEGARRNMGDELAELRQGVWKFLGPET